MNAQTPITGDAVYVVVEHHFDGSHPKHIVHGVYSSWKLAALAAYHPHGSLMVLRLLMDAEPVDEAEVYT